METTETTQPSLDGHVISDDFSVSGDFVIVTDAANSGPGATINERWYRLYSHSKAMCELMLAFNSELEPGYAPQGLGVAVHDQLSKLENLVTAARILITPAIAASGEWKRGGAPNPERWFAGKTGKSPAKARAEMETGKNLGNAPGTRKAFLEGELSAEQAETISDVAEVNPEAEQALLDAAKKKSLKELKDEAARRKAEVEDIEAREKRIHKKRHVRTWTDSEGAWNLHAKGTIPDGADFASVLERLIDQQFKQARKNGVRGTRDNYAFDALMNMAAQHGTGGFGDPGASGPWPTDAGATDPGPTNPCASGPRPSDPGPTDLGPTNPDTTNAGPEGSSAGKPGPAAAHEHQTDGPPTEGARKRRSQDRQRQVSNDGPTAAHTSQFGGSPIDRSRERQSQDPQQHLSNDGLLERGTSCDGFAPKPSPAEEGSESGLKLLPQPVLPLDLHGADVTGNSNGSSEAQANGRALGEDGARRAAVERSNESPTPSRAKRRARPPISQAQTFCIDWNALLRGRAFTGERCELRGAGAVSVAAVRRALETASAKLVLTDDAGRVVTVAHLGTGPINLRLIPGHHAESLVRPFDAPLDTQLPFDSGTDTGTDTGTGTGGGSSGRTLDWVVPPHSDARPGPQRATNTTLVIIRLRSGDLSGSNNEEGPSGNGAAEGTVIDIPGFGGIDRARVVGLIGAEATSRLVGRGQAVRALRHSGRAPTAAQRVALLWAETGCKVEGCPNQRVEIDHRNPWATEKITALDNLDPLCSYHHGLKTQEGWRFVEPGSRVFVGPEQGLGEASGI